MNEIPDSDRCKVDTSKVNQLSKIAIRHLVLLTRDIASFRAEGKIEQQLCRVRLFKNNQLLEPRLTGSRYEKWLVCSHRLTIANIQ